MNLSEKLIFLRKQKGFTQLELAEKLNVSRQAVSRWEVGTAVPSIDNLKIISNLYDVPVDYLLNDNFIDSPKASIDTDIDTYRVSTATGKETGQENSNVKFRLKQRHIFTGILIVVIVVLFFVHVESIHSHKQELITPIKEMEHIVADEYATVTFPLE